jgi:putative component of toxin-antitoxin plasmid stabilization module
MFFEQRCRLGSAELGIQNLRTVGLWPHRRSRQVSLVLNFQVSLHLFIKSYEGTGWFSDKDVHAYIYARFLNQLHLSKRGKSKPTQKAYDSLSNAHDSSGNRIYMTKSEKDIIVTTFFACGLTGQLGSSK